MLNLCYTLAALSFDFAQDGSTNFGNCFDHSERTPDVSEIGLFCWASRSEKRSFGWQEGSENGVIKASRVVTWSRSSIVHRPTACRLPDHLTNDYQTKGNDDNRFYFSQPA